MKLRYRLTGDPQPQFSGHPDNWAKEDWRMWCDWYDRQEHMKIDSFDLDEE